MPERAFNLLSPGARQRATLRRRARRWRNGVAVHAVLCVGLIIAGSRSASESSVAAADGLRTRLGELESEIDRLDAERAALGPQLEVAAALRERPEWGLLLEAFNTRLDNAIVLSRCVVQPAGGGDLDDARSGGFTVELYGFAPDAHTATMLTLDLEALGVFTSVTLLQARSATVLAQDAVAFHVRCTIAPHGEVAQ